MKVRLSVFASFFGKKLCRIKISIVALIMWVPVLISCNAKVAADIPSDLISTKKMPSVEATDFQTSYTDSGVVKYFLKTPKLLIFDKEKPPYKEFPEGFLLQQFAADKKIVSELSANYGKNLEREEKWLATGNVILVNNKGDTLRTEELIYLIKEDKIFTDKFVSIKRGDGGYMDGTGGFESDSQMTKWAFKKTKGQMYFEGQ